MSTILNNALRARVDRALRKQGQRLRVSRSDGARRGLGEYFVEDIRHGCVVGFHVDPFQLGRDLGVVKDHERVE